MRFRLVRPPLYLQISEKEISVCEHEAASTTSQVTYQQPVAGFENSRVLIGSFEHAERSIAQLLADFYKSSPLISLIKPIIIVHVVHGLSTELSDPEKRAVVELFTCPPRNPKARQVILHQSSQPLTPTERDQLLAKPR